MNLLVRFWLILGGMVVLSGLQGSALAQGCWDSVAVRYPGIRWGISRLHVGDLTFDDTPEIVYRGQTDSTVAFAILECANSEPGEIWKYEVGPMCGFSDIDFRVESPRIPPGYFIEQCTGMEDAEECIRLRELMERLEAGAEEHPETRGFRIGPEDCDGLHFFWDATRAQFSWWRP